MVPPTIVIAAFFDLILSASRLLLFGFAGAAASVTLLPDEGGNFGSITGVEDNAGVEWEAEVGAGVLGDVAGGITGLEAAVDKVLPGSELTASPLALWGTLPGPSLCRITLGSWGIRTGSPLSIKAFPRDGGRSAARGGVRDGSG